MVYRGLAVCNEIAKLRRVGRQVVDDHVGHHVDVAGERLDVRPVAQPRVDAGVVGGVESGVGAVDRIEEGQQVHAAEHAVQRAGKQRLQVSQRAAAEAVNVGDQLNLVLHDGAVATSAGRAWRTNSTATAAHNSSAPARRITLRGSPPSRLW